jgi:hypothetical protein
MDALTLIDQARKAGLAISSSDGKLIVRGPKKAEPVVRLLAARKQEVLSALAQATGWRARHREALEHWGLFHSAAEAAGLAWGEIQVRWHRRHGRLASEWQCVGCSEPIGGLPALDLPDGNRVHFDKFDCLLSFGERWRAEATAGLEALGLKPPPRTTP